MFLGGKNLVQKARLGTIVIQSGQGSETNEGGGPIMAIYGKGAKIRYLPVHPMAARLIGEYLEASARFGLGNSVAFLINPEKGLHVTALLPIL